VGKSVIKFGTDGWRAVIGREFTDENVAILSQAVADFVKRTKKSGTARVVIGYDARFRSEDFAAVAAEVLAANGIKVVLGNDYVPTPAVSFYCKYQKCDLGIMITASHNPHQYNGYKLKSSDGGSADTDITGAVEGLLEKTPVKRMKLADAQKKKMARIEDITAGYFSFIKKYVNIARIKKLKMRVLVDLMHGSGRDFIKQALTGAGSKICVEYLRAERNTSFGGVSPEPIEKNLKPLLSAMKTGKYDLGVALDGDADRIAISAQTLVPLLAVHLVRNRKWTGGIVKTVVGSNIFDNVARDLGQVLYETPVGFKYISALFKKGAMIGGEEAGGIGFKDYIPERDGSVAAMLLLEMCSMNRKNPVQLVADLEKKYGTWTYAKSSVPASQKVKDGLRKMKMPEQLLGKKVIGANTADGIKIMTRDTWLMFRASGTEPIVRCYSEAHTQGGADKLLELGMSILKKLG
jgi:alpha-D-glucose phosphate-specific phosphoglucomutase